MPLGIRTHARTHDTRTHTHTYILKLKCEFKNPKRLLDSSNNFENDNSLRYSLFCNHKEPPALVSKIQLPNCEYHMYSNYTMIYAIRQTNVSCPIPDTAPITDTYNFIIN